MLVGVFLKMRCQFKSRATKSVERVMVDCMRCGAQGKGNQLDGGREGPRCRSVVSGPV